MTSIGTGYDLSASQFSPDGRVFQIEYAGKAVENSGTAVAIRGKDGVVFAVEKIVTSKLYEKGANRRIFNIDTHIGMAAAGLVTDARQLASIARDEVRIFLTQQRIPPFSAGEQLPAGLRLLGADLSADPARVQLHARLHPLQQRPALRHHRHARLLDPGEGEDLHHRLTYSPSDTPINIDKLIAIDLFSYQGAELYCLEPSGVSYGYWGCAAGKAKSNAKTELEKINIQEKTCEELVKEAAKIIYMVHDEVKDKMFELELSWVGEFTAGVHKRVPDTVSWEIGRRIVVTEILCRFTRRQRSSLSRPWRRTVTTLTRICHELFTCD